MCGRYALTTSAEVLAQLFRAAINFELHYRYNIAPTQIAPVARAIGAGDNQREVVGMQWGLIPSWAKDPSIGSRMINARSETAAEKPSFRSAFKRRRCLVPASGFYEWKKLTNDRFGKGGRAAKQPFYIYRADEQPLVMAGLWESWTDPESNKSLETYSILTTDANDQLRDLHDRMPAILEPEQFDAWIDPEREDAASLQSLLKPAADGVLAMHPVSTRVNSPKHDEPSLVEPNQSDRAVRPDRGEQSLLE
jgi:putative SOS response-associated peptidase YedK